MLINTLVIKCFTREYYSEGNGRLACGGFQNSKNEDTGVLRFNTNKKIKRKIIKMLNYYFKTDFMEWIDLVNFRPIYNNTNLVTREIFDLNGNPIDEYTKEEWAEGFTIECFVIERVFVFFLNGKPFPIKTLKKILGIKKEISEITFVEKMAWQSIAQNLSDW